MSNFSKTQHGEKNAERGKRGRRGKEGRQRRREEREKGAQTCHFAYFAWDGVLSTHPPHNKNKQNKGGKKKLGGGGEVVRANVSKLIIFAYFEADGGCHTWSPEATGRKVNKT